MADPLAVAASIVGLQAAASQVSHTLSSSTPMLQESQKQDAESLYTTVISTINVLNTCNDVITNPSSRLSGRAKLLQVDEFIMILTSGVLLFSDVERLLSELRPNTNSTEDKSELQKAWSENSVALMACRDKMKAFEQSLNVFLGTLQDSARDEAITKGNEAPELDQLAQDNANLAGRLAHLEDELQDLVARNISTMSLDVIDNFHEDDALPFPAYYTATEPDLSINTFHEDLHNSRPYKMSKRDSFDNSFRSSVERGHAWSGISQVTSSRLSLVAVRALLKEVTRIFARQQMSQHRARSDEDSMA